MKNVHLIATDKPSKLHSYCNNLTYLRLSKEPLYWKEALNIYITDNSEIKEEDWIYGLFNGGVILKSEFNIPKHTEYYKEYGLKIILTTDQDLIKDGIQAIDDEFLEWFVKNSSCEFVEMTYENDTDLFGYDFCYYKLTIPKEEPNIINQWLEKNDNSEIDKQVEKEAEEFFKQRLEKYSERFDNKDNEIVEGIFNTDTWGKRLVDDEPKQETEHLLSTETNKKILLEDVSNQETTLEEAAKSFSKKFLNNGKNSEFEAQAAYLGFIACAKWQQEQDKNKYSEEDMVNFSLEMKNEAITGLYNEQRWDMQKRLGKIKDKWFKQFKKK